MSELKDLPTILNQARSSGPHRDEAEKKLKDFEDSKFNEYLLGLTTILGSDRLEGPLRQFAGVLLKGLVGGSAQTSTQVFDRLRSRWMTAPVDLKKNIKQASLQVLSSQVREARRTGAYVIAQIAKVETIREWKELIPLILNRFEMAFKQKDVDTVESIFLCIATIAEECAADDFQEYIEKVLPSIFKSMSIDNNAVRTAATKCLYEILPLLKVNMGRQKEAQQILQLVVACCGSKAPDLQLGGFLCLQRIASLYYEYLSPFMGVLFVKTRDSIRSGVEGNLGTDITKQAIEFWSSCADAELKIKYEKKRGPKDQPKTVGSVSKAMPEIVPIYLKALTMHSDDEPDEDEWDVRKASGCSLELFAQVVGDEILETVCKFVGQNVKSENWHAREAAVCAFGLVLEGPKVETLIPRVKSILGVILSLMNDRSVYVRQTANWCFGRICSCVPQGVAGVDFMSQLRKSLFEQPSIAHYACWSISSLATFYGQNKINSPLLRPDVVPDIIKTLLERAEKQDADARVVSACFEAINQLISNGPKDNEAFKKMANQLLPGWIERVVNLSRSAASSDHHQNMLAATLSTLNVSLNVLGPHCLDQKSTNRLMDSLINLGATNQVVIEEALLCISYVCYVVGDNFFNYFRTTQVQTLLVKAVDIDNHKNPNLCQVGAAVIGDCLLACTNSIKKNISSDQRLQKFTDEIVRKMLTLILHMDFPLEHKPHLLGTLTDVGIAFGPFWERYTNVAINNSFNLALAELSPDADTEDIKAMTEIRETLVDMCRATMLAMSEKGALPAFGNFLGSFLKLLQAITKDPFRTEREVKIFLDFINEMIEDFRSKPNTRGMLQQLKVSAMQDFLNMALSNPNLKPFAQQAFQGLK